MPEGTRFFAMEVVALSHHTMKTTESPARCNDGGCGSRPLVPWLAFPLASA
jgi:hypothetical protein